MAKKLRALSVGILAVLMCFALSFGLVSWGTATAENRAIDRADDVRTPVAVYVLGAASGDIDGASYYADTAAGWTAAVKKSVELGNESADNFVRIVLASDWIAQAGSGTTAFGSSEELGYIIADAGCDIELDLNGHVIDRGLESATENGYVMRISGKLTLTDSATNADHGNTYSYEEGIADENRAYLTATVNKTLKGGIITGGYSSNTVGGIWVDGELTLNGGTVYGNKTENQYGGGVYVQQNGLFTMNGGAIIKNTVEYNGTDKSKPAMGGGVAVYGAGAKFTLNDGLIADNVVENVATTSYSDANGGGVEIYGTDKNQAEFVMAGGKINNNRTISYSTAQSVGGAIGLQYSVAEIAGGEISDNRALQRNSSGVNGYYSQNSHGSAIGANAYNSGVIEGEKIKALSISGGLITRNAAFYGTIYVFGDQYYSGGEIVNNISVDSSGVKFNDSISGTSDANAKPEIYLSGTFSFHDNWLVGMDANKAMNIDGGALNVDASWEFAYIDLKGFGNPETGSHDIGVGKLDEGVTRSLLVIDWVLDRNIGVTKGYTDNNSKVYTVNGEEYKIPVNPNKYFVSGRPSSSTATPAMGTIGSNGQGKIVLNSEGEVAFASSDKNIVFTVTYDDNTTEDFDYENCDYCGLAITYSDKSIKSIAFNGIELENSKIEDVGMYEFSGRIGTDNEKGENNSVYKNITELFTIFRVVVMPKEITADDDFAAVFGTVTYDGSEKTPVPTSVTFNGVTLTDDDYTIEYGNNINASDKAQAVFKFKGNYCGEVAVNFTISVDAATAYKITWEYYNGTEWGALSSAAFVYDGTDQSGKVRAALTVNPDDAAHDRYIYVYAQNVTEQNTTNMYLRISGTFDGESEDRLLNAAKYTVTIAGTGNYSLPEDKSVTVTVAPQTIVFGSLAYEDGAHTRLWQLKFGESTSNLRDSVTYIDGDRAVVGEEVDAYARFRNMLLTVELNPNYVYNSRPLSYYIDIADVAYNNAEAVGSEKTVTDIKTTVTFVFNANFAVSGAANNTVTIEKNWHIVTINNGLLNSDDTAASLPVFTYGEQTTVQPFKPEHGNEVYFTFRQGTNVKTRIAVVYGGDSKTFYLFDINSGGNYVLGDIMPDADYFATVINNLNAGNYQLDVHLNEYRDVDDVVYYAIDRTFNLTVDPYNISETNTANKRIAVAVTTPELVYSDSATAPDADVTFDGQKLVCGEDYTITTSSVNVGAAVACVKGLGNFGGSLEIAFTITKAVNEWVSAPNIIRWVYGEFNSSVNIVTSKPKYMSAQESVAYTVLDSDKKAVNTILTNFHVESNGVVSATVAKELGKLSRGTYYLVSKLRDNGNYSELDTSDNPLEFNVIQATNVWLALPSIIQWRYDEFDKNVNRIYAVPKYLDDGDAVKYSIATDAAGVNVMSGLANFTAVDGVVSDTVADVLNNLPAGRYYLVANVNGSGNYSALTYDQAIPFDVSKAMNAWADGDDDLVLPSWIVGNYNADENPIVVNAAHGSVNIVITDIDGNEYYNSVTGVNKLNDCEVGKYLLKAWVDETDDFAALAERTFTIDVLEKVGLPWWGTLLIVIGALLVAAAVILILLKKGVFQILTEKVVVSIRTRASVDATIASVRAAKMTEEGKQSVAEAKRRERIEEMRRKTQAQRALPPEERAAQLEVRAQAEAEKAEKIRVRSEALKAKAEKLRGEATEQRSAETDKEVAATDVTENPTEE